MSRTMHSESPLEPEPTEPALTARMSRADAEALGERIQRQAARIAEATCELLEMVSEFDGRGGTGWYVGLKSTAHWLAWACSMSPGTAREHVRVARALPSMPLTVAEFRAGRLSSSKVRGVLPAEIGAEVVTALELALGRDGHEPDPGSSDAPGSRVARDRGQGGSGPHDGHPHARSASRRCTAPGGPRLSGHRTR